MLEEEEKMLSQKTPASHSVKSEEEYTSEITEERTNEENWWFGHKFEPIA